MVAKIFASASYIKRVYCCLCCCLFCLETGALFAPCMRDDHGIQLMYSQSDWINMTSMDDLGCCEVNVRNTAGTTTASECVDYTSGKNLLT